MKKMKFTLGLMLSMLILGANAGYAQYNSALPHNGGIESAMWVQGCDFYADNITFEMIVKDADGGYGWPGTFNTPTTIWGTYFDKDHIKFADRKYKYFPAKAWPYGSGAWTPLPIPSLLQDYYSDYYFDTNPASLTYKQYCTNSWSYSYGVGTNIQNMGNLFYWLVKSKASIYNQITVYMDYTAGNELHPILKRLITLGKWVTVDTTFADGIKVYQNQLISTGIVIEQIITADAEESWYRPDMDRGDGPAKYVYKDQILPLLGSNIIYSIDYELAVYDEYDYSPGATTHEPSQPLPQDARKIFIETADGITTNPNTIGNAIYVSSLKNFEFTAYSASEITAETITLHQPYGDFDPIRTAAGKKGVLVKDNKNGSYTITVIQVNQEMLIKVKNVASTSSGDTGNEAFAADAVWAASGTLFVQAANPATLSVYTVTGQLFFQTAVTGSYSMTLPKGLYIVQLNGKAYKIIN